MITVQAQPGGTINFIGNPIMFKFVMTGIESGNTIRRMGYQLLDESNNPISALESCSPSEGEPFILNFQDDIRPYIFTEVPSLYFIGVPLLRDESSMLIKIKLKYWEIVYNKETCKSSIENVVITTTYPVINATNQYFGYASSNVLGISILTLKPYFIESCDNDLFYFYTETGLTFKVEAYSKDGTLLTIKNETVAAGVWSYHVTSLYDYPNAYQLQLIVNGYVLCKYIKKCCNHDLIYFQQSGGGYSTIELTAASRSVDSSSSEIYRYQPVTSFLDGPDASSILQRGGLMINNKKSFKTFTFYKDILLDTDQDLRFYEDFLSSGSYFLRFESLQGQTDSVMNLVKFILDNGSIKYYEAEEVTRLVISGHINQYHNRINNHI